MKTIAIDFEVFKSLTSYLQNEDDTYNHVLRRILKLETKKQSPISTGHESLYWLEDGIKFPEGTEFRAVYNGKTYIAKIQNANLTYQGKVYSSFSAAANVISNSQANGWRFWKHYHLPNASEWKPTKHLENQRQSKIKKRKANEEIQALMKDLQNL